MEISQRGPLDSLQKISLRVCHYTCDSQRLDSREENEAGRWGNPRKWEVDGGGNDADRYISVRFEILIKINSLRLAILTATVSTSSSSILYNEHKAFKKNY